MRKTKTTVNSWFLLFALSLFLWTFGASAAFGQTVAGKVLDEKGNPMPGVNVIVSGSTIGTITNLSGEFSIDVVKPDASLIFSFIGYQKQVVDLEGRTYVEIQMILDAQVLDDVVVIGYGTVQKNDLTGSVGVVTAEDLNKTPIPNIGKALQGKASGVVVMQSGDPGGDFNIRVRGIGSITDDPDPLVVIDGIIGGDMSSIAPEDIQSISVLKDASATAIYGANGANGVIMITTKRGTSDRMSVSLSAYTGMNYRPKKFNLMNADEYADFYNSVYDANGESRQLAYTDEFREWYYGDGWQTGTDWQDEILQKSTTSNIHLRLSNGGEKGSYSISANIYDESGILLNTNNKRYNFRANSDFKIGKYLRVGESVSYTRRNWRESNSSAWGMSLESSPLMKVYNEDNKEGFEGAQVGYLWDPDGDGIGDDFDGDGEIDIIPNTGANDKYNPKGELAIPEDMNYTDKVMANVYVEIKPFPWLTFTTTPSISINHTEANDWTPSYDMGVRSFPSANLVSEFSKNNAYSLENKLSFDKSFGDHSFNVIAVHHARYGDYSNLMVNATGFPYEQLNIISQSETDGQIASGSDSDHSWGQKSYLARLIYNFKSKYLFTASIRRDGSSNFLDEYKWGSFPSFSAAWKINEDFLNNVPQINMLKLRAGWGMTGNSDIGGFRYQTSLADLTHFSPVFGIDQTEALALNELWSIGNTNIKWEAANMSNIGLDLNAFGNKIQFSMEYYIKNQSDLLMEIPVSTAFGKWSDQGAYFNIAEVRNSGFEFDIKHSNHEGSVNYNIFANLATVKNEILDMPSSIIEDNNISMIGHTIGSLYGYVAEGIVQDSDFDEEGNYLYAIPSEGVPSPGDLKFKDLNQDGEITDTDRTIIGKSVPDFSYSFGFDINYRNFDFSVFMFGIHDAQIYNTQRRDIESFETQDLDHNKSADWAENFYSADNPSDKYLRLDPNDSNLNTRISTWWVEDASFLRLKDVQLGYNVPASVLNNFNMRKARIYISGSNLFTFTKYTGYDPESPLNNDEPTLPGVDSNNYPIPRTVIVGVQFEF